LQYRRSIDSLSMGSVTILCAAAKRRTGQEMPMSADERFEEIVAGLPVKNYQAGDTVLSAGTRSGLLLILRKGAVAILKDGVEIAKVVEPGAVLGELAALLDQPHTADVRAVVESEFHVADAALIGKERAMLLHVARILARRIVAANRTVVELKSQMKAGQSPGALNKLLTKVEEMLSVGGSSYET
jgi:CRP/FNR family transcriptional regulator, cyclic AMP receptor protein